MYYTGFADEAGRNIDTQIKATSELGWKNIESRHIGQDNIHDMPEAEFEKACAKLKEAGIKINCFGSAVANWGKDPRKEEDFEKSKAELTRALKRMQKLDCKMIRAMSFAAVKDAVPDSPELEKIIFSKVQTLVDMCAEAGVIYLHENCMNYGGMSHEHTLKLLDNIKGDNFKLLFDTGNPPFTWRRIGKPPYRKQSSWEFYSHIKDLIHYVHIKDAIYIEETTGIFPKSNFTMPGEGDGDVEKIVGDLLKNGYNGGFSIEPHLAVVHHEEDSETKEEAMYNAYIDYGRKFMELVERLKSSTSS